MTKVSVKGKHVNYKVKDTPTKKILISPQHNFVFNKTNGNFARWGKTPSDDPSVGYPEILDIEVTTICTGQTEGHCPGMCYKSNGPKGKNMKLETFMDIIDKISKVGTFCQLAVGADYSATSNPDIFRMMSYAREKGIIPNITIAKADSDTAANLARVCGAVAVSLYDHDTCYSTVELLRRSGMKQINIHFMLAQETVSKLRQFYKDYSDNRMNIRSNLNAIVVLSLKKKGRGKGFNTLPSEEFSEVISEGFKLNVPMGFDSCSAHKVMPMFKDSPQALMQIEPCESSCFSTYINVDAEFSPCSFCEGTEGWEKGIDIEGCEDFIKDVWMHPRTIEFREKLLSNNRRCPIYEV